MTTVFLTYRVISNIEYALNKIFGKTIYFSDKVNIGICSLLEYHIIFEKSR